MAAAQKVIAVTGGFGFLGRAVVDRAVDEGWQVAIIDYASRPPDTSAGEVFDLENVDLTIADVTNEAISKVVDRFGRIDALANIAGGFRWETVSEGSIDTWDTLYNMNVKTTVNASKAVLPHMIEAKSGAIVNIGAMGATRAAMGMGAYAASKAGVARLTEGLSEEVKAQGIRVNAILPSIIDTSVNRADMPDADFSTWVTPDAIADVLMFLVSDGARSVHGALIPVSGLA